MLLKILGWIWLISGVVFLLKPEWLRENLKKKSVKKIRRYFFGLALLLGVLLINATWGIDHILAKILLVCGVIAIFKAVFFLKAKAADQLVTWFVGQSTNFFRMWSVGLIVFGALILTV